MTATKFGRYEIKSEIGRGGMATVFHAYDPRFERDVAIKVLPHEFLHDPQFRVRFEREAKMIALIEHPAIVPVYDFGEEDGQPYIVMRYMSGGSLADRLGKSPLPLSEVTQMISRLAPALDAAHAKGIVHRDLKPGNILFDQYGNAFLSDFGIARLSQSSGATLTGTAIVGTPAYMSPEQIQGDKEIDGRSDIYSLGIILFQMLSGSTPYQADTPAKVMMMHLLEPVPQIKNVKSDLPAAFEAITERALAKLPSERFSTASEMAAAVESAGRGESLPTLYAPGPTRIQGRTRKLAPPTHIGATAPPKKTGLPGWAWILGGLAGLGLVGIVTLAAILAINGPLAKTPTAVSAASLTAPVPSLADTATVTPQPSVTETVAPPSLTPTLASSDTPTLQPSDTPTPTVAPSETPTGAPAIPVIGGADKVAFIHMNNVYLANLDGSGVEKLTSDNAVKSELQWTPDGKAIIYLTGKRVEMVEVETRRVTELASFDTAQFLEGFRLSADGTHVAISLDHLMYIVPFDAAALLNARSMSKLNALAECKDQAPIIDLATRSVRWSLDGKRLAFVYLAVGSGGRREQRIRVIDISECKVTPTRVDELPAGHFAVSEYGTNPRFDNFSWDGESLIAFNSFKRNDGFGDLYVYNIDTRQPQSVYDDVVYIDPINKTCCYRDPAWSPDGRYLIFAFQDINLGSNAPIEIYYIPYSTAGTGKTYEPIVFGPEFFTDPRSKPQFALRPAQP